MKKAFIGVAPTSLPFTISLYFGAAFAPFILDGSQLLLGTVVNALLAISAFTERDMRKIIPLLFLPSLATLGKGLLFGPLTPFLLYMIPLIWIGNLLFILILRTKSFPLPGSVIVAACGKSLLLFATASAWISIGILPKAFATSMGFIQLVTALLGGFGAYGVIKGVRKNRGGAHV